MSAPFHDIEGKAEAAYVAAITAGVTTDQLNGASVFTCVAAADIASGTRVVCECTRTRGVKGMPGNYMATVTVRVNSKATAASTKTSMLTDHRSRTGYVRDLMMDSTFADILTAAGTDFTVQGIMSEIQTEWRKDTDHFIAEMTQEIYCNVSD